MKHSSMKDNNAPEIKITEQTDPKEGYRFIHINNGHEKYSFQEEMTFKTFDGQQILKPHISQDEMEDVLTITQTSYKFNVAPGDSKMVIIRCNV